jgi:hypothetical protein
MFHFRTPPVRSCERNARGGDFFSNAIDARMLWVLDQEGVFAGGARGRIRIQMSAGTGMLIGSQSIR